MRTVTIQRSKSFIGCLVSSKVYIEDPTSSFKIDKVPCRLLGKVKNGKSETFTIEEDARRLFVIADKITRNFCFDVVTLPAGSEPLFLSGRHRFSLFTSNAFRFDNVTATDTLDRRAAGFQRGAIVFTVAFVIGMIIGASVGVTIGINSYRKKHAVTTKTYSAEGMSITLDQDFMKSAPEAGIVACYTNGGATVAVVKESFADYPSLRNYTVPQYGNAVIQTYGLDATLKTEEGLTCFEYDVNNPTFNLPYHYYCVVFKGPDAFWMFEFCCMEQAFENYHDDFIRWAQSVEFDEP